MIDIKLIRESPEKVEESLRKRHSDDDQFSIMSKIKAFDLEWRNKESADEVIARSGEVSARIKDISVETSTLEDKIKDLSSNIPNILLDTVPMGETEKDNPELRKSGKPDKNSEDVLAHYELAAKSEMIDFERGVKLAQHRFAVLTGDVAKLERALINFMLSVQTSRGYLEVVPPYMVNTQTMTGTGQLPKFEDDLYNCRSSTY